MRRVVVVLTISLFAVQVPLGRELRGLGREGTRGPLRLNGAHGLLANQGLFETDCPIVLHDLCHLCVDESTMADALRLKEALSNRLIAVEKKKPELIEAGIAGARLALVRMEKEKAT
jgi:hypothetical protein